MNLDSIAQIKAKVLEKKLKNFLKAPLCLTITDNTRSILSARRKDLFYFIRLHHMFLDVDNTTLRSLADYLKGQRKVKSQSLRVYIQKNSAKIRQPSKLIESRKPRIVTIGKYFDLQEIFGRINDQYFAGRIRCRITWGNRRRLPRRRSIRLGSYSYRTNIIRINPALDRSFVPEYVAESIVYHEMLHCRVGSKKVDGRNYHHHRAFKCREREFEEYQRAKGWIKNNLTKLLCQ